MISTNLWANERSRLWEQDCLPADLQLCLLWWRPGGGGGAVRLWLRLGLPPLQGLLLPTQQQPAWWLPAQVRTSQWGSFTQAAPPLRSFLYDIRELASATFECCTSSWTSSRAVLFNWNYMYYPPTLDPTLFYVTCNTLHFYFLLNIFRN